VPRTTDGVVPSRRTGGRPAAATRRPDVLPPAGGPVKLSRAEATLEDRYRLEQGTIFLTGLQALVRGLLDHARADRHRGMNTAIFASGYPGSPLGGLDQELLRLGPLATEHALRFTPGLNEELAATAVYGSQLGPTIPGLRVDGVTGVWFGKNPGLDRAMDALRHANLAGTHPLGGALAIVGDDPAAKSSTLPSAAEATLAALQMPTFFPGNLQEVLDFTRHAIACSRASGLWSAVKIVTAIADAAGTASVWPDRVGPVIPEVVDEGHPYRHRPNGRLLGPVALELERTLHGVRTEIARQYGALNQLNPVTISPPDARLGIVAAGRTYYETVEALAGLGLGQRELARLGIRLMKVGLLHPHDDAALRAFGRGLREIVVVEEKLPFLERALRDALYATTDPPRIVGRRDDRDEPLLSVDGELDADAIALALARRLRPYDAPPSVAARVTTIEARRARVAATPATLARTPTFCSGCPHNTSTANPDDTLVGAGIGCHTMVLLQPHGKGTVTGITQMGGEGAQFAGIQPFADGRHVVQNLGDGTFHHSASLAVRFAVAAGLNVTYKLLYNDVVAMTGAQAVQGQLSIPDLTRWLALEGVAKIIVTTEDPKRYRKLKLDPIASVRHRDELAGAQAELAEIEGVTVLIHDQHCAADLRRLRRRGRIAKPAERIAINERVCEGCGDCGEQSSCASVVPVATEFGRKTQIHQSSCNVDRSCLKGDCPAFVTVTEPRRARATDAPRTFPAPPANLPEPTATVGARDDVVIRMAGIGGTGVVTTAQIIGMAALLDGRHAYGLDQTGLSQKGGPVVSDVRLSRAPIEGSNRAAVGRADLLLGFDVLGAANPRNLLAADPDRTVAVVNGHATATAAMITDTTVRFPALERNLAAIGAHTRAPENVSFDAETLAVALFGDHLPTNTIVLGAAFQIGRLPLSAAAIEQAIRLNGAAVEQNLAAFAWGRAAVAAPDVVTALLAGPADAPPVRSDTARAIVAASGADGELRRLLEIRVAELIAYGGARLARRYADDVMAVARTEARQGAAGETGVAEAFARHLYKLLAYKDEYEVARLHLDVGERARLAATFGDGARVSVMLHPPLLRALGLKRKIRLGRTATPLFRSLRRLRWLRGTPLDPFGHSEVRRLERALPDEYRALVERALRQLTPATHATVARIAELPDGIRGYEQIKLRNVARFREQAAALEAGLAEPGRRDGVAPALYESG